MEFPSNGHFSYIAIESDPKRAKEVQYVYDDSEMVKAESDDYSNITEVSTKRFVGDGIMNNANF